MLAIENNEDFDSYWTVTSDAKELLEYISKDYNGLTETIAELIGGVDVKVNTTGFANDLTTFRGKNDVFTLLIHLGYLAYDADRKTARIPNEEIRQEFQASIHEVKHEARLKRLEVTNNSLQIQYRGMKMPWRHRLKRFIWKRP